MKNRWLLPEYIEDVLPAAAWQIEEARANLLSLFKRYGYELVIPPHIEYIESLTGVDGDDLDLKTFKLVDQLSGRQLGLRADMTPQVARIDAHLLNRDDVARLCYAGHVVHTLPAGHFSTREPLQVGAELYGSKSISADLEIIELMVQALKVAGLPQLHVDIGHVGIFRALCEEAKVGPEVRADLFSALQTKDVPAVNEITAVWPEALRAGMLALPGLFGPADILEKAKQVLPALPAIVDALDTLTNVCAYLKDVGIESAIELAELRTGHYHNGLVFTAFADGWPNPVARGGRYDNIGQQFGRGRAATGFSLDLRDILRGLPKPDLGKGILAPDLRDAALRQAIDALRDQGEMVKVDFKGLRSSESGCDRELVAEDGRWVVKALG
ncbi:ATP phosphoribosyltransferase regulatory subunit [Leeia oryzae]|uniref:ATP phosphoribosyltransferase regulatory subunit n=1 Tax=Leeia oryzae TaxID=356662 RepID=UPI00036A4262|nr:ATP phosphoribosyltransferase regulatory subunit [Leeia oryzae]